MIYVYPDGRKYKTIPCPFCGQDEKHYPREETARYTIHCQCGAESHGTTKEDAFERWNAKDITHPLFTMPEDEIGRNKILIYFLREKIKHNEAYYKEQIRKREIALDNLRAGRPENADGGDSDYLRRLIWERNYELRMNNYRKVGSCCCEGEL